MSTDLPQWLQSPLGGRVLALERKLVSEALSQVFGFQLLQIGHWGETDLLMSEARTQRKAVLARQAGPRVPGVLAIESRTDALAIASDSIDAVLLPHTLEHEPDPHELLREVERILMGDGHLIVLGFRSFSGWGCRHLFARSGFPPGTERLMSEHRLRDWLKLLGFEIVDARRYLFTWPWGATAPRAQHLLEMAGENLWPLFAGAYLMKARKRVYAVTPIRPRWRAPARTLGGLIEPTTRVKS